MIIRCQVTDLENRLGYYLAESIYDPESGHILLKANYQISQSIIESLKNHCIDQILVSDGPVDENTAISSSSYDESISKSSISKLKSSFDIVKSEIKNKLNISGSTKDVISNEIIEHIENTISVIIEKVISNKTSRIYLSMISDRDDYIIQHSANVTYLVLNLVARSKSIKKMLYDPDAGMKRFSTASYNPTDLIPLGMACLLHDIGKVAMLDLIQARRKFSKEDPVWLEIKKHPIVGYKILFGKKIDSHALLGIKYHHENFDGSGYPYGIDGYKIHPYARIIRVVDSFDAATSNRPGNDARNPLECLKDIVNLNNKHYDPLVVTEFLAMIKNNIS